MGSTSLSSNLSACKKQAATIGLPKGQRMGRRIFKACQSCRSRKVRCNLLRNGTSCTRCRSLELHEEKREDVSYRIDDIFHRPIVSSDDELSELPSLPPLNSIHDISLPRESVLGAPAPSMLGFEAGQQNSHLQHQQQDYCQSPEQGEQEVKFMVQPSFAEFMPQVEACRAAASVLFMSTLTPDERSLISALIPLRADQSASLNSILTGAVGLSPRTIDSVSPQEEDLENEFDTFIDLDECADISTSGV